MCCDSPDTSGINAAAVDNAQVGKDALDWYKQQYADGAPARAAATQLATQQATLQTQLSQQQLDQSQEERGRYNSTFVPIENKIASDAMAYDTPARREAAADAASADTENQISLQRQASDRDLERAGVQPGSGRSLALQGSLDVAGAAAKAGAANKARQDVETIGAAKLNDAAGIGRGVFTNQGTTAGIALSAGNSSVANGQVPGNVTAQGASLMGQGFQTAMQGNSSAGALYGQAAGLNKTDDSGLWKAAGAVGGAMLAMSDENEKTDKAPVNDDVTLAAVRKTPVSRWKYRSDSVANDGGMEHVGPMAQDVQKNMGEAAGPGGKAIDLISMNGITLSAVKALDKKVSQLQATQRRMGARQPVSDAKPKNVGARK